MFPGRTVDEEFVLDREQELVRLWRLQMFLFLGCNLTDADLLAASTADWHDAEELLQRGCHPDQLVKLLA